MLIHEDYTECTIMQQPDSLPTDEAIVRVHTARSWTEAVVVRGLLESAGIAATELGVAGPTPMPDLAPLLYGIDIFVLKSQQDSARQLIAEHQDELDAEWQDADEEV